VSAGTIGFGDLVPDWNNTGVCVLEVICITIGIFVVSFFNVAGKDLMAEAAKRNGILAVASTVDKRKAKTSKFEVTNPHARNNNVGQSVDDLVQGSTTERRLKTRNIKKLIV
jgi:hypothetical protein